MEVLHRLREIEKPPFGEGWGEGFFLSMSPRPIADSHPAYLPPPTT